MKEQINDAAITYLSKANNFDIKNSIPFPQDEYKAFINGVDWMQEQYKGLTPETVEKMICYFNTLFGTTFLDEYTTEFIERPIHREYKAGDLLKQIDKELTK